MKKGSFQKIIVIILSMICVLGISMNVRAHEKRTLTVGTNAEYAPFDYLDENGNITGFDIDLIEAIAKSQDIEIVWRDLPFDSLIGSMEAGDLDVIAAAIGPTSERKKSVDFSDIYYTGSQSIICKKGNDIKTFKDLAGLKVAVLEGSIADLIASGENQDYGIVEDAQVVRFKNASSAVMELLNGGVDATLIDSIMAENFCRQTEGLMQTVVKGTENDSVFCVQKGNSEMLKIINAGLAEIRENGTYDEIYEKYFGGGEESTVVMDSPSKGFLDTLKFVFVDGNRWKYYVKGLGITLLVSLFSVVFGVLLGLIVAIIRINEERKNKKTIGGTIAAIYVDIIRGTPSVLQLMIIYFVAFHSRLGFIAAVVSFGINSGAYVSEVIRGGIQSIDRGQMEAGRSLGLSYGDTMRFIVIPQAVKNILPAMGNEFIQLIKETSILGYVGIMDLTKAANYVSSRTYQMFIPLVVAGIIYYLIVKILTCLLQKFERGLRKSD